MILLSMDTEHSHFQAAGENLRQAQTALNLALQYHGEQYGLARDGDVDDVIGEIVGTLEQAETILEASGWPGDGDFLEALQALADRADKAPKLGYDL